VRGILRSSGLKTHSSHWFGPFIAPQNAIHGANFAFIFAIQGYKKAIH
jgi:hypothetical protein